MPQFVGKHVFVSEQNDPVTRIHRLIVIVSGTCQIEVAESDDGSHFIVYTVGDRLDAAGQVDDQDVRRSITGP